MVDEAAGDAEKLRTDRARLTVLRQRYKEFSKDTGLRTRHEQTEVAEFWEKCIKRLVNSTQSGIIEPNSLGEIPEVSETTGNAVLRDVTEEYLNSAAPNSHIVQDVHTYTVNGSTYTVDGHNMVLDYTPHEKEIAELLERKIGGELFMVPRVNSPQGG